MTDFQGKLATLALVALLTILFVYKPWRPKKRCPSCGTKVFPEDAQCHKCHTALH